MDINTAWLVLGLVVLVEVFLLVKYRKFVKILVKYFFAKASGGKFVIRFLPHKVVKFEVMTPDPNGILHFKNGDTEERVRINPDDIFWQADVEGQVVLTRTGNQFTLNPYKEKQKGPDPRLNELAIIQAQEIGAKQAQKEDKMEKVFLVVAAAASAISAVEGFLMLQLLNQIASNPHVVSTAAQVAASTI